MSKKSVAVRIAGHEYKIRSDADDEFLRQIALYVDQAMDRVRKGTGTVDSLDVAVLTCLNLGRELLSLKSAKSTDMSDLPLRALIERVESAITPVADKSSDPRRGRDAQPEAQEDAAEKHGSKRTASSQARATAGSTPVKTLDLPSVESLRAHETDEPEAPAAASGRGALPERRVAAGGRDRAS